MVKVSFSQKLIDVIPPSPNAAALGKFEEIPTEIYTGIPQINIPIWNIRMNEFQMPISIDYHAGGVKMQEYASNVGMGWAFNCGGVITRSVNGLPDDCINGFINPHTSGAGEPFLKNSYDPQNNSSDFDALKRFSEGEWDSQPDFFYFNFNGRSGKFVFDQNRQIYIVPYQKLKVESQSSGGYINQFTVTTEEGDIYVFSEKEKSFSYSQSITHNGTTTSSSPCNSYDVGSSWYLTEITSKNGQKINLYYNNGEFGSEYDFQITNLFTSETNYIPTVISEICPRYDLLRQSETNISVNQTYAKRITRISFPTGQINFGYNTARADLVNDKMLTNIDVVNSENTNVKSFVLGYLYSNANGSFVQPSSVNITTANQDNYRLFLDNITEKDANNNTIPAYQFSYYGNVPGRLSGNLTNADYWGFYNGGTASLSNKTALLQYAQVGTLQKIVYPTGGSSSFVYERNDCQSSQSWNVPILSETLSTFSLSSYPTSGDPCTLGYPCKKTKYFTITNANTSATGSTIGMSIFLQATKPTESDANFTIFNSSGSSVFCTRCANSLPFPSPDPQGLNGTYLINNWTLFLPNDTYKVVYDNTSTTYVPTANNQNSITINWRQTTGTNASAGGIRIKTITNKNINTQTDNVKTYDYSVFSSGNPSGLSSGFLVEPPVYPNYNYSELFTIINTCAIGLGSCVDNYYSYLVNTETSPYPLGTTKNSNVGYSIVTEYFGYVDDNTGYITRKFKSPFDIPILGQSLFPYPLRDNRDWARGILLEEISYKKLGYGYAPVTKMENLYNSNLFSPTPITANTNLYPGIAGLKVGKTLSYTNTAINDCISTRSEAEFTLVSYFGLTDGYSRLEQTKNSAYDGTSGLPITTTTNYYYDNAAHFYPTRIETMNSKGQLVKIENKYPLDIIPPTSAITTMINRNIISPQISSSKFIDGSITQKTSIDYNTFGNNILPNIISSQNGSNTMEQRVNISDYNTIGSVLQEKLINNFTKSYIYDYKNSYTVAEITNSGKSDVAYTSFESDGKGNLTFTGTASIDATSPTGNNCYNLGQASGNITKTGLISGNQYIVSYWTKNLTSLTINGTAGTKGRSINTWTYYQHLITLSGGTITISGTGYIDELRLYPANAQMTTYTYKPLIGISSQCDVNNRISYYEYDTFGRLKLIRDQDKNIIKRFDYQYQQQP
jgi:hypothetical protein